MEVDRELDLYIPFPNYVRNSNDMDESDSSKTWGDSVLEAEIWVIEQEKAAQEEACREEEEAYLSALEDPEYALMDPDPHQASFSLEPFLVQPDPIPVQSEQIAPPTAVVPSAIEPQGESHGVVTPTNYVYHAFPCTSTQEERED